MKTHTPGPWRWMNGHLIADHGRRPVVLCARGAEVAGERMLPAIWTNREESGYLDPLRDDEANARLIAAAPEMLQALKAVASTDAVRSMKTGGVSIQSLIDAAIAKAEGKV